MSKSIGDGEAPGVELALRLFVHVRETLGDVSLRSFIAQADEAAAAGLSGAVLEHDHSLRLAIDPNLGTLAMSDLSDSTVYTLPLSDVRILIEPEV